MDNYKFDTRWFRNEKTEDIDALKLQLVAHKKTLDKLVKILYNMIRSEQDVKTPDYETPSWAHKEAHRHGKVEILNSILSLATLDKEQT